MDSCFKYYHLVKRWKRALQALCFVKSSANPFVGCSETDERTMVKENISIKNKAGLHARPAASLVKTASKFEADFFIHMYGYRVNGKSILGVMTLAAEKGAELELEFDGPDENEALEAVKELINNGFGEEI